MFYEDYTSKRGDSLRDIAAAYGYEARDWGKVWNDRSNTGLVRTRRTPDGIREGDRLSIPIPWRVVSKTLTNTRDGAQMVAERDGELGRQLSWVQTVYRDNQPIGPNPNPYCVDACTPDDDLPFYWTNAEIVARPNRRKRFFDHSSRPPPSARLGTTRWRAIVSLAVVTGKRVGIWNSLVWGWDMTPANVVTTVGPRTATDEEIRGHLHLLRTGVGTAPGSFTRAGWTFRKAA
jgi:hypothetical protein